VLGGPIGADKYFRMCVVCHEIPFLFMWV